MNWPPWPRSCERPVLSPVPGRICPWWIPVEQAVMEPTPSTSPLRWPSRLQPCGVPIAKHGNRSASGKVGSADVLEGLGLELKAPPATVVDAINAAGVTFPFAPAWHPALVNLAPLRRSLGIRTVFNLLGPLVNPLRPDAQVLGVARDDLLDPMAGALQQLGLRRAVVVHGAGGLDEASLAGPNQIRLIDSGSIRSQLLSPEDLGLKTAPPRCPARGRARRQPADPR